MSEQAAFLAAIRAEPDDDTRRLAYADWLQEHGDEPGARWIRARVASPDVVTRLGPSDSVSAFGGIVARGVRSFRNGGAYPNGNLFFRRGFVERVECTAVNWIDRANEILSCHPVREVVLTTPIHRVSTGLSGNPIVMLLDQDAGYQFTDVGLLEQIRRLLADRWPGIEFLFTSPPNGAH